MKRLTIHNPATRQLRPVDVITDRAKRYRAVKANAQQERRCIYCGRPDDGDLHTEHVNGKEADNTPDNLAFACRSCNTAKGAYFARAGIGKRTAQYNPTKAGGAANIAEWLEAVGSVRPKKGAKYAGSNYGAGGRMSTAEAVAMIRATPPDKRSSFASEIWNRRHAHQEAVPF